jgi:hypothetical protein
MEVVSTQAWFTDDGAPMFSTTNCNSSAGMIVRISRWMSATPRAVSSIRMPLGTLTKSRISPASVFGKNSRPDFQAENTPMAAAISTGMRMRNFARIRKRRMPPWNSAILSTPPSMPWWMRPNPRGGCPSRFFSAAASAGRMIEASVGTSVRASR